jgi:hypothetical protein
MTKKRKHHQGKDQNPLFQKQTEFLNSLSKIERNEFFAPSLDTSRRAELWMQQADLGEKLVNRYSWATPDEQAMRILKHFSPIIEIASGQGYWLEMMRKHGIDAIGYDIDPTRGGKISKDDSKQNQNVRKGGPNILERPENRKRNLFLCYPDEDNYEGDGNGEEEQARSLASACLRYFSGDYVIHVGELFMDSTLSMDQAPWGRSSSSEFQEQLAAQFHCVIKVSLPSWLHVRDTLSVWKRSQVCSIVFEAEDGDESDEDEEVEYR